MANLEDFDRKATAIFGLRKRIVGKTQVRKDFLPLVDTLRESNTAIEITDHDKPVAVLIGYEQYVAIMAKACLISEAPANWGANPLLNSIELKTDDLEAASAKITEMFEKSIRRSLEEL